MPKTSVVIFDCDGVMFDSRQANINFYNHLLAHFGLQAMREENVPYVHMHTADEAIRYLFRGTPYLEEALAYRQVMDYTPFITDMMMEPGLREVLDILRPEVGLAVATNRSNTIGEVLESNGLDRYFDIVVSSLDVKNPKPDPESLFKILEFFSIEPQRALYVGDSRVDYETAKAASVPFMAYKNRTLDAAYHADHLMDVAEQVLGIPTS